MKSNVKNKMGHWEDFYILTHKEVNDLGKRKEFDSTLKEISEESQFRYTDARTKWEEALKRIKEKNR